MLSEKIRFLLTLLLLSGCAGMPDLDLSVQNETTLATKIEARTDDAEEFSSGRMYTTGTDLELSVDRLKQTIGLRFADLAIPQGAIIENAYIGLAAAATESGLMSLNLYAHATDDAKTFTTAFRNISSRPLTRARATWSPAAWQKGSARRTSDLKTVVQEVVNRPGWQSGNALAVIIKPRALPRRTAVSFDGSARRAPILYVTYSVSSSPPEPTAPPSSPVPSSWNLVFEDTFGGNNLDTSKWNTSYHFWRQPDGGSTNEGNRELQWYLPNNVSVGGGTAKLTAKKGSYRAPTGKTYGYTSGILSSHRKFEFTYGYIETRMKIPAGQGLWPASWTLPIPDSNPEWPPEIDMMEILGHEPAKVHFNLHYLRDGRHTTAPKSYSGADLSAEFHTYGCLWEPGRLVFYLDGVERHRIEGSAVPTQPMYLLLNLAVGGNWPGAPDTSTLFPADFDIDYIRVMQNPSSNSPLASAPKP